MNAHSSDSGRRSTNSSRAAHLTRRPSYRSTSTLRCAQFLHRPPPPDPNPPMNTNPCTVNVAFHRSLFSPQHRAAPREQAPLSGLPNTTAPCDHNRTSDRSRPSQVVRPRQPTIDPRRTPETTQVAIVVSATRRQTSHVRVPCSTQPTHLSLLGTHRVTTSCDTPLLASFILDFAPYCRL